MHFTTSPAIPLATWQSRNRVFKLRLSSGRRRYHRTAALRSVGPHAGSAVTQQALTRTAGIVGTDLTADVAVVLFGIMTWLFLAWANGKGFPYARVGAIIVFVFYTAAESMDLSQGAATVAPAPTIASLVVMTIGLAVVALLLTKRSWDYYARHAVAH